MFKRWGLDTVTRLRCHPEVCRPLTFDPGTWPWRVGCQTITPEPQPVGCHVTLLAAATGPRGHSKYTCECVGGLSAKQQS